MGPKDAVGTAMSVDPDQTAPLGSGSTLFTWVCTICQDLSVRKLRIIIITVHESEHDESSKMTYATSHRDGHPPSLISPLSA